MTQAFNLSQLANNLNSSGQLDATDGLTGAVPAANGGTGLSAVGTTGNVLTSNGTGWVSQALPTGGVTSLNGQNGAIVNTDFNAIGSYTIGAPNTNGTFSPGSTRAGTGIIVTTDTGNNPFQGMQSNSGGQSNLGKTGTWRAMSWSNGYLAYPCCGVSIWSSNIWVRIS